MKTMTALKMLPCLLCLTLVLTSCDKDDDPAGTTENYQPLTVGSTWTYETTTKPANTKSSYTLTATAGDSSINGKTFKIFTNTAGENDYYYNNGNEYYQFGGIAGITGNTELLYLKSHLSPGAGWEETKNVNIPGLGVATVKLGYTFVEKLPAMSLEGQTYNNVLHVQVVLSNISVGGFPLTVTSQNLHFYYAPNVGRVKSFLQLTITPPIGAPIIVDNETNLKSFLIK